LTLSRFPSARWVLSSFDEDILLAFRQLSTTVELVPIVPFVAQGLIPFVRKLGAPAVALMASSYSESSADLFAREQIPVIVWTVNDIDEARRVESLGAYGICTDCPARMIGALRSPRKNSGAP
jgi:glycerophosphoryl diester phosphodiesterase